MNYDLIVFDWDGTLMDSAARIVTCLQMAAAEVELPVPTVAASRDIIGLGLDEAMGRLFPGVGLAARDALVAVYRRHWLDDKVAASPMFDGAVTLVQALHAEGRLLAVATGKSRRGLDRALGESGLGPLFHATRCADEAHSKPHPQMLQDILTDLDTQPESALVIGDTEYDMQMARSAGVDAIGIEHGVHDRERLLAHGAQRCVADLFELAHHMGVSIAPSTAEESMSHV
jgi:phosphoglycolate phosphatase